MALLLLLEDLAVRKFILPAAVIAAVFATPKPAALAEGLVKSTTRFYYKDTTGHVTSAGVVHRYWSATIVHPFTNADHAFAKIDPHIDARLLRAASFAEERAHARSKAHCWQYVKEALLNAGAVNAYPKTPYACQAGEELTRDFGFQKLSVRDPYDAPVGAVLVYGHGSNGAGHVEIRTKDGFVSDYFSKNRCYYPLVAAYAKF